MGGEAWNVPPTWGNAGRGNVKNGGILGAVGYLRHPGTLGAGVLILDVFFSILGGIGRPFGSLGDPTLAILRPRGRHFAAPGRHPRHQAEKTCILVAWRCEKVRVLQGAGSDYIW